MFLIFLDSSGDNGFRFAAGASPYLVIVIVIFDTHEEAEHVNAAIIALRQRLNLRSDYEFRFSTGSSVHVKREFLQTLLPFRLRYRALIVNKAAFQQQHPERTEEKLFNAAVSELLRSVSDLQMTTIFVDQVATGEFARKFNVFVRQQLRASGARPIRKFKHVQSHRNNLIQVADMISGAIYRAFVRGDDAYWKLIQAKEDSVIEWK